MYKQQKYTHTHNYIYWSDDSSRYYFFIILFILLARVSEWIAMYSPLSWWLYVLRTIASLILIHFLASLLAFFFLSFARRFFTVVVVSFYIYFYRSLFRQNFSWIRILNVIQFSYIYGSIRCIRSAHEELICNNKMFNNNIKN